MKAWTIAGVLVAVAGLLVSSAAGYAEWWVDHETTDCDKYESEGGEGGHHASANYYPYYSPYVTYADVWAQIEGEQQNTAAAGYAYIYWTDTIMDYDPNWDPPLLAHVSSLAWAQAYALYDLDGSDYDATAAAHGYANGYRVDPYIQISNPESGDIDNDWFDEDIDIFENGYPIYLREFAYATAQTLSTEVKVKATAYADANTVCVVVQNP
jgi:hypothetical protein